MAVDMTAL